MMTLLAMMTIASTTIINSISSNNNTGKRYIITGTSKNYDHDMARPDATISCSDCTITDKQLGIVKQLATMTTPTAAQSITVIVLAMLLWNALGFLLHTFLTAWNYGIIVSRT